MRTSWKLIHAKILTLSNALVQNYMVIKMMNLLFNDCCKILTKKDNEYFINAIELFELNDGSLNLITLINYIFVKKYV
jgi:hypothetical protein